MSSYGTLAGADAYHLARGNTTWTGTDEAKDIARLRGSEYVDSAFRSSFAGYKAGDRTQIREWPRHDAYDVNGDYLPSDEVPTEVENATYEAALRELVTPGTLLPDYDPTAQVKREKVDVLEVEYSAPHGVKSALPVITSIGAILAPVLTGSATSGVSGQANRV